MRVLTIIVVMVFAGAVLSLSAALFDTTTVVMVGVTMGIVAVCAASTVLLGVVAERRGRGVAPHDDAEVIRNDDSTKA